MCWCRWCYHFKTLANVINLLTTLIVSEPVKESPWLPRTRTAAAPTGFWHHHGGPCLQRGCRHDRGERTKEGQGVRLRHPALLSAQCRSLALVPSEVGSARTTSAGPTQECLGASRRASPSPPLVARNSQEHLQIRCGTWPLQTVRQGQEEPSRDHTASVESTRRDQEMNRWIKDTYST